MIRTIALLLPIAIGLSIGCSPTPPSTVAPIGPRISGDPPVPGEVALRLDQGPADNPSPVILAEGIDPAELDRLADDPEACRKALVVRNAEEADDDEPMSGRYEIDRESAALRFIPDTPLDPGERYRADWNPAGASAVSAEFVTAPRHHRRGGRYRSR